MEGEHRYKCDDWEKKGELKKQHMVIGSYLQKVAAQVSDEKLPRFHFRCMIFPLQNEALFIKEQCCPLADDGSLYVDFTVNKAFSPL